VIRAFPPRTTGDRLSSSRVKVSHAFLQWRGRQHPHVGASFRDTDRHCAGPRRARRRRRRRRAHVPRVGQCARAGDVHRYAADRPVRGRRREVGGVRHRNGYARDEAGVSTAILRTVSLPVTATPGVASALATPGTITTLQVPSCSILHLVLGPLDLNLLGLNVYLDQAVLDISAVPGVGQSARQPALRDHEPAERRRLLGGGVQPAQSGARTARLVSEGRRAWEPHAGPSFRVGAAPLARPLL
jgi:hypothetical protein